MALFKIAGLGSRISLTRVMQSVEKIILIKIPTDVTFGVGKPVTQEGVNYVVKLSGVVPMFLN